MVAPTADPNIDGETAPSDGFVWGERLTVQTPVIERTIWTVESAAERVQRYSDRSPDELRVRERHGIDDYFAVLDRLGRP